MRVRLSRLRDRLSAGYESGVLAARVSAVAMLASIAIGAAVTGQTYLSMLGHGHSLGRMLAWQVATWSFWGMVAPLVVHEGVVLAGAGTRPAARWQTAACGGALILLHVLVASVLALWIQPFVPVVTSGLLQTFGTQFVTLLPVDLLACLALVLVGWVLGMARAARQLELRESRLEAELAKARLEALRLEIQPHFIFNTLNTIAALVRLRSNDAALEMIVGLGELMRLTLDRANEQQVTLGAEIDLTARYIDLQRARFGDRLMIDYRVAEACRAVLVPSFVLQPLVENALRHGMGPRAQQCRLEIGASLDDGGLHVWVTDDGVGLPPGFDVTRDARTGLGNVRSRLARLYGAHARLAIEPQAGGGTRATLVVPEQYGALVKAAV